MTEPTQEMTIPLQSFYVLVLMAAIGFGAALIWALGELHKLNHTQRTREQNHLAEAIKRIPKEHHE